MKTAREYYQLAYHLLRRDKYLMTGIGTFSTWAEAQYVHGELWLIPGKYRAAAFRSYVELKNYHWLTEDRGDYFGVGHYSDIQTDYRMILGRSQYLRERERERGNK